MWVAMSTCYVRRCKGVGCHVNLLCMEVSGCGLPCQPVMYGGVRVWAAMSTCYVWRCKGVGYQLSFASGY